MTKNASEMCNFGKKMACMCFKEVTNGKKTNRKKKSLWLAGESDAAKANLPTISSTVIEMSILRVQHLSN